MPAPDAEGSYAQRRMSRLSQAEWKGVEEADHALKALEERVIQLGMAVRDHADASTLAMCDDIDRAIQRAIQAAQPAQAGSASGGGESPGSAWRAIRGRADHMIGYVDQVRDYVRRLEPSEDPPADGSSVEPGGSTAECGLGAQRAMPGGGLNGT